MSSAEDVKITHHQQRILDFYDRGWHPLVDEYYGHSNYMNYGYWTAGIKNQAEACENLIGKLLAMIPNKKGNILDAACGRGASTRHLLRDYRPCDIVAINISEKQLKQASELAPGCTFLLRDAAQLEFPDCSFDNILCVEAAFHFDTRDSFLPSRIPRSQTGRLSRHLGYVGAQTVARSGAGKCAGQPRRGRSAPGQHWVQERAGQ